MQTEQQVNTTQTKKSTSSGVKKEKKLKSKTSDSEQQPEQVSKPVEPIVEKVVKPVLMETKSAPVVQLKETTPEVEENKSTDEVVLQELDFSSVVEFINTTSDRLLEYSKYFKDSTLSKDERGKVETLFKKFQKSCNALQNSYYDHLSRQVSTLEKSSGSKSSGMKKVQDKEKSAIHKKLQVHPFLLNFMKLEQGTLVSRSDALTAITGFVKLEKEKNPDIIVATDKRSFKLIGELKILFNGIEQIMKSKNLLDGKQMPTEIKYTQIMQYMTHCFIKTDEPNVV
jgi:hypothetical protein